MCPSAGWGRSPPASPPPPGRPACEIRTGTEVASRSTRTARAAEVTLRRRRPPRQRPRARQRRSGGARLAARRRLEAITAATRRRRGRSSSQHAAAAGCPGCATPPWRRSSLRRHLPRQRGLRPAPARLPSRQPVARSRPLPPCELYCHSLTDPTILAPELRAAGAQTLTLFGLHMPARLFAADHDGRQARGGGRRDARFAQLRPRRAARGLPVARRRRPAVPRGAHPA